MKPNKDLDDILENIMSQAQEQDNIRELVDSLSEGEFQKLFDHVLGQAALSVMAMGSKSRKAEINLKLGVSLDTTHATDAVVSYKLACVFPTSRGKRGKEVNGLGQVYVGEYGRLYSASSTKERPADSWRGHTDMLQHVQE